MKTLDELIFSVGQMGQDDRPEPGDLDLLLYSPCPVKLAVKEKLDAVAALYEEQGDPVSIHIPMGCTSVDPYDPLHLESDPEQLPGIIASIGFGDFFRKGFSERFVKKGQFTAVLPESVHPLHEKTGILDPEGHYTVYALTPYILMVDTKRLGDAPMPTCWDDLMDPCYKGQINMCGDGDDMADAVLMNYYKDHGMEGIRRFAANTKSLLHSSRMGKSGGAAHAGGIYILPYFFAETSQQPAHMQVIWPEDGCAASPIYFLAKQDARPRLDRVLDFFIKGFGEIDSARWFLPLGGPLPQELPAEAKIKWVGWDFIYDNHITDIRDELNSVFRELVRVAPCD